LTDENWGWTVAGLHFGIDTASHRLAQCANANDLHGALDGYGDNSLGANPLIQTMIGAAGPGVSAEVRTGANTCISPRPPAQPVTGSKFTASELVITDGPATTGTIALAYPSASVATADLAARKAAFTAAQAHSSI